MADLHANGPKQSCKVFHPLILCKVNTLAAPVDIIKLLIANEIIVMLKWVMHEKL